ncbi:uncharacterized protein LOC134265468 isoform X1 [Saccostrea cucullata]|uniref:uncharacterized protein LOC134265468 isoform X1 n=1 Tax=Saccostrea cuccullata TaxID=36930 RepID=UPI002ED07169
MIILFVMAMIYMHKRSSFICVEKGDTLCSKRVNKNSKDNTFQDKSPASDGDSSHGESIDKKIRRWSYPLEGKREKGYSIQILKALESVKKNLPITPRDVTTTCNDGAKELTEKDLWKASKYLVPKKLYISVVRELGLLEIDIQVIHIDYKRESVQEIAYQTLLQLKKKNGCIMKDTFKNAITQYDQEAWNNIIQSCQ